MSDFFQTTKGEVLKSMMRRPETAQLIQEALNSPVGSTSRAKAQKIFSIVNKLNISNSDGAGGPGMPMDQSYMTPDQSNEPIQITAENSRPIVVFKRIPTPKIKYGKRAPMDGGGGPGYHDGAGGTGGIVEYLNSTGQDSSYSSRAKLAAQKGISNYSGTASQNIALLNAVKSNSAPAPKPASTPAYQPVDIAGLFKSLPSQNTAAGVSPQGPLIPVMNQPMTIAQTRQPAQMTTPPLLRDLPAQPGSRTIPGLSVTNNIPSFQSLLPKKNTNTGGLITRGEPGGASGTFSVAQANPAPKPTPVPSPSIDLSQQNTNTAPDPTNQPIDQGQPLTAEDLAMQQQNRGNLFAAAGSLKAIPVGTVGGQCGAFVNDYLGTNVFGDSYESKVAQINSNVPTVGSIAIVPTSDPYGHVAIVESVNPDGSVTVVDSNWGKDEKVNRHTLGPGQIAGYYSPNGSPAGYAGIAAAAQAAVNANTGAGMFAMNQIMDPNNPMTHGKSMTQAMADEQKSLWDKYNVGDLQKEESRLREEGAVLPKDVTAYIKARDQYLNQTDKEIDRFIEDSMDNTDMSDPANAAKANAQLNYLYTLRGRQNQTYIGYLNDAVEQHQTNLDHVSNLYQTALTSYESDLKNNNAITEEQYKMYSAALADMYTAVEQAPLKALQKQSLEQEMIDAHTKVVTDNLKANQQAGYIEQYQKLKGHIIDNNNMVMPGVNLADTINKWIGTPEFPGIDTSISSANIIQAYTVGVSNYLSAPDQDGTATNPKIDFESKKRVAEEAIRQFSNLSLGGGAANNPNTVMLGLNSANDIAERLAEQVGSNITKQAPQIIEAVQTLAPRGWFGGPKAAPSEQDFLKTVAKTTGDSLDESISRAIYAVYLRYVQDEGNTPDSPTNAVHALLYPTSSTTDRANQVAFTPDQFARNVGSMYASNVLSQSFR
jgi:hypothetical protein